MAKKAKMQTSFKNGLQASHLARIVATDQHRGSSTENKIEAVLNGLRETTDIDKLKDLDSDKIQTYLDTLYDKLQSGELSSATTSSYVSALNDIIQYANEYAGKNLETVSAKDFNLNRGEFKFHNNIVSQKAHNQFLDFLKQQAQTDIRAQALMHSLTLQRELGLRLRESIRITKEAISQALKTGILRIDKSDGTKNGQARDIPLTYDSQKEALKNTLNFIKEHEFKALIPNTSFKEQRNYAQNIRAAFERATGIDIQYHGERKFFLNQEVRKHGESHTTEIAGHHRPSAMKYYKEPE